MLSCWWGPPLSIPNHMAQTTDRSVFTRSHMGKMHTPQCVHKKDGTMHSLKMHFTTFLLLPELAFRFSLCSMGSLFFQNWVPFFSSKWKEKLGARSLLSFEELSQLRAMVWKPASLDSNSACAMNLALTWSKSPVQSNPAFFPPRRWGTWTSLVSVIFPCMRGGFS